MHKQVPKSQEARGRQILMMVNDGADRCPRLASPPYFDFTRRNLRREWSKWRDLDASGQVLEWIRNGVAAPWATVGPSLPFNQGVLYRELSSDQASFLKEEIERLKAFDGLRPAEYSRWVSRALLVPKMTGSGWRLIVDLWAVNVHC